MTYNPATSDIFKASFEFAAFSDVSDEHIAQALDRALSYVGQNWVSEGDYQLGQMYYAAHTLNLAGLGAGAEAQFAKEGLLGFNQIRSGGLTVSRSSATASNMAGDDLRLTTFGVRYLELARRNAAGPYVAS